MKVLILTDKYPPDVGGLAVSSRRLARGLVRAGHSVWVSLLDASLAPGESVTGDDLGVSVLRVGSHRRTDDTLADWFDAIVALDTAQGLDIIHALYVAQPAFIAVATGRYLRRPTVVSARGNDLDRSAFDPGKFAPMVWALQHASAVTAVSTDLARKVRTFVPERKVHCLPNGVDTQQFAPGPPDQALASSLGLGDAPVIAFVGEARRKKGITVLLPAFAHLCARLDRPPTLLLVGGVRRDDAPILEVFRRQNPALDICTVPYVLHEQLPAYYRLADLLVLPSLREGLPNALLEGMACSKAIIASKAGGIPDVLGTGDRENGLLVPPGDVAALSEAMERLLADPDRRTAMGLAARATVQEHFTPEREIERNLEIYAQWACTNG
jgi:phosphatidylinositol alpha-1,6-mannosyltransferase